MYANARESFESLDQRGGGLQRNGDQRKTAMKGADLLYRDEVYRIVGAAFEVMRELGKGFREKTYERALVVEFGLLAIPYLQQPKFPVHYKAVFVDEFIPDLVVFGNILVETKTVERISDQERGQMLNYLRITGHPVGLILNFKHNKLEWERIVLTARRSRGSEPEVVGGAAL